MEGLLEIDFEIEAQVSAAPRALLPPASKRPAEDRLEDVAEIAEALAASAAAESACPAILERGMAKPVVSRALLRVGQARVGRADRLELGFGFLATGILVRMAQHCDPAIG